MKNVLKLALPVLAVSALSAASAQNFDATSLDSTKTTALAFLGVGVTLALGMVAYMVGRRFIKKV
jgi:hypothetical protein